MIHHFIPPSLMLMHATYNAQTIKKRYDPLGIFSKPFTVQA